ncbi:MAG: hypothetical protein COA50_16880 [Flavobacteriaceae bacterium]|nr:MAG: hypothetical protein COA50_16880 [Flavobacteriaceae bacterium]
MAYTNQIITNPIIGDRVKFLITEKDSNGKQLRVELWCKPNAQGTPLHYHPLQDERFEVVKGKLGVNDNGKDMFLNPGENYTVLKNSIHRFWNADKDKEVLVLVDFFPALKTEYCLETIYSLANQGKSDKGGMPKNPLQLAAMMNNHYGELFFLNPPIPIQKFMAKVVGRIAKLVGYKGYVPMI